MKEKIIEILKNRNWDKMIGKTLPYCQSLYEHAMISYDVAEIILDNIKDKHIFNEKEKKYILLASIIHDAGKETQEWQNAIKNNIRLPKHINKQLTNTLVDNLSDIFQIDDKQTVSEAINLHMSNTRTSGNIISALFSEHKTDKWHNICDFVDSIDNFVSCGNVLEAYNFLNNKQKCSFNKYLYSTYHLINIRGVSSTFLHRACQESYIEKGWVQALYYPEGTVYISSNEIEAPSNTIIMNKLETLIKESISKNVKNLVVPNVIMDNKPIPREELFDFDEYELYLSNIKGRKNPTDFQKFLVNPTMDNKKIIESYCYFQVWRQTKEKISQKKQVKEILKSNKFDIKFSLDDLKIYSNNIIECQDEVAMFKFFRASIDSNIWKVDIKFEIEKIYNKIFGENQLEKLLSMSNNDYPFEFAYSIIPFWNINLIELKEIIPNLTYTENICVKKMNKKRRIDILKKIFIYIWKNINYDSKPKRSISKDMSKCFIKDIVNINNEFDFSKELNYYLLSKINSKRETGKHICPICNSFFDRGPSSTADLVDNPGSFNNRAISHGMSGKIIICDICRKEKYLQQILLNTDKLNKAIFLFPQYNLSQQYGNHLLNKIYKLKQKSENLMSELTENPSYKIGVDSYCNYKIAQNVLSLFDDIEINSLEDFIITENKNDYTKEMEDELIKYFKDGADIELPIRENEISALQIINDDFNEKYSKWSEFINDIKYDEDLRNRLGINTKNIKKADLTALLIKKYGDDFPLNKNYKKALEIINEDWDTSYSSWEELITVLKNNKEPRAREIIKNVYKIRETYKIIAQTPNMIIIPLISPIKNKDESITNGLFRELFISIILAIKLNCSVAITDNIYKLDFSNRKGNVFVPDNHLIRNLVGETWIRNYDFINEKKINVKSTIKWLKAIASALVLTLKTEYSNRTSILNIFNEKTSGHLLRRIELKNNYSDIKDINLIENIMEVK